MPIKKENIQKALWHSLRRGEISKVKTQIYEIESAELNKLINRRRREETRKGNLDLVEETIQNGKSLKTANRKLALGKQQMISLKDDNGEIINCS